MFDFFNSIIEKLAITFGAPPWIVLLTLVFFVVLIVGIGMVLRDRVRGGQGPNWNRDPDQMKDLSPQLRQARMQMIAAGIAMGFILLIAVLNLIGD